jgi:hypothetical protein
MRKVLIALGVLVILAVVVVVVVYTNLDEIVRRGTEKSLAFVLQVDTGVEAASVKPAQGVISFDEIVVGNPEGYDTGHALRFGEVHVEADIASFRTDVPTIRLIRIREPDIILERLLTTSNLEDLIDNASRLASGGGGEEAQEAEAPAESQKSFKIERLEIAATTVQVALPFDAGETLKIPIPDVVLEDLGGAGGVKVWEAREQVLMALLTEIADVSPEILGDLDDLRANLDDVRASLEGSVQEALTGAREGLEGEVQETVEELTGGVRDLGENIGGLLGRGREDD